MSLFNQLINGKGHPNFGWEVAHLIGNDAEVLIYTDTYAEALTYKLRTPHKKVLIELYYNKANESEFVGDETEMLNVEKRLKEICTNQNIVLSL